MITSFTVPIYHSYMARLTISGYAQYSHYSINMMTLDGRLDGTPHKLNVALAQFAPKQNIRQTNTIFANAINFKPLNFTPKLNVKYTGLAYKFNFKIVAAMKTAWHMAVQNQFIVDVTVYFRELFRLIIAAQNSLNIKVNPNIGTPRLNLKGQQVAHLLSLNMVALINTPRFLDRYLVQDLKLNILFVVIPKLAFHTQSSYKFNIALTAISKQLARMFTSYSVKLNIAMAAVIRLVRYRMLKDVDRMSTTYSWCSFVVTAGGLAIGDYYMTDGTYDYVFSIGEALIAGQVLKLNTYNYKMYLDDSYFVTVVRQMHSAETLLTTTNVANNLYELNDWDYDGVTPRLLSDIDSKSVIS